MNDLVGLSIPIKEIVQQAQSHRLTFFRMELHCKNIIPRDSTGKRLRILAGGDGMRSLIRYSIVAMNKIKTTILRNTFP